MIDSGSDFHNDASEEPLIEIPHISGNEYIRKSQISNMDIRGMVVRCTSCLHQINHHDRDKVKKHVHLNVIVCNDCSEFYGSGEFSQDESGNYNYCAWCGNGGKLFLCDYCPNTFCSTCVRRNFGRAAVSEMSKEGWKCYMCQPEKLKSKVAFCDLILEYCKKKEDKKEKKTDSILAIKQNGTQNWTETHDWILSAFDATNDTCKSFHKRLEKLRNIGMSQSKSIKHIIKKFEDIVNNHKGELNLVIKSLSRQYNSYLEAKKKCEEQKEVKNNLDKTDLNNDKHKVNGLDVSVDDKLNEEILSGDGDKIKIEDNFRAKLSLLNVSDSSLSGDELKVSNVGSTEDKTVRVGTEDKTVKVGTEDKTGKVGTEDKTGKVGTEGKTGKVGTEDKTTPLEEKERKSETPKTKDALDINDENISVSDMAKNVTMQEKEKESDSDSSFKISFKNKAKKSVNRKLCFNSASEELASSESSIILSSGSDGNEKSKMLRKKLVKSRPKIHKTLDYNDPKLKMKTSVVVEKCDELLVNGKTTVKIPEYLILEEMDKEIDALLRLPEKKTFRDKMPKDPEKAPKKVKAPRKKKISESSSSICLTSSGEETEPNFKLSNFNKGGDANTAAKNEILNSDLSIFTDESDEESEPQKKKSKKKKVYSGSSDDFQPKKKKKYDKLLHKRLISDDDDDKDKKTGERKPPTKRRAAASDDSKSERKKSDSDTTTTDSEELKLNKKKRRKRIKKAANSSSSDGKEKEDGAVC
ncbi:transcriptional regulator ATRX [Trichonephila clavipes]|nr:transcriptional regulator ATRX [Trichonephila clavipes]